MSTCFDVIHANTYHLTGTDLLVPPLELNKSNWHLGADRGRCQVRVMGVDHGITLKRAQTMHKLYNSVNSIVNVMYTNYYNSRFART